MAHFSLIGNNDNTDVLSIYWYERTQNQENMPIYMSLLPNLILEGIFICFVEEM